MSASQTQLQRRRSAPERAPACLWMQAGVVLRKRCDLDYQCAGCRFDSVMSRVAAENRSRHPKGEARQGKKSQIVHWTDRLRELAPARRPCIHHMKQRIAFRTCTHDYRCGNCEFDQYFYDQFTVHAMVRPVEVLQIRGIRIPQGFYLHRGHAWAKVEENQTVRVGLDDFALRLLGPLDQVQSPLLGKPVLQGRGDIALQRGHHSAQVCSPVSGVVTDINPRLREKAAAGTPEAYSDGWLMRVHCPSLRSDLKNLLLGSEASDFLTAEVDRLFALIEETEGPLAADGGQLSDDIFGKLPRLGWQRLSRTFLRT